jgi:MTH538 TIR-like domain (DUF1863)
MARRAGLSPCEVSSSVVCVLVGSDTWWRRWVRYEIARAIVDGRGLLAVHLNSIRSQHPDHASTRPQSSKVHGGRQVSTWEPVRYYPFERKLNTATWQFEWVRYEDYTREVKLPRWLAVPDPGLVMPLASYAGEYDYMTHDGHKNIGTWLDRAARRAGR